MEDLFVYYETTIEFMRIDRPLSQLKSTRPSTGASSLLAGITAIALIIPGAMAAYGSETELDAVHIAAGGDHNLAVGVDGEVFAWGSNVDGQLGTGDQTDWTTPVVAALPSGEKAREVAAGTSFSLAVTDSGNLYAWGTNTDGQLGQGTTAIAREPKKIPFPASSKIVRAAAGTSHVLAVTDVGDVYAWGARDNGEVGNEKTEDQKKPVKINFPTNASAIVDVAGGDGFSLAIDEDGVVYSWGLNKAGQLGNGKTKTVSVPTKASLPETADITQISAGKTIHWQSMTMGHYSGGAATHPVSCASAPKATSSRR